VSRLKIGKAQGSNFRFLYFHFHQNEIFFNQE